VRGLLEQAGLDFTRLDAIVFGRGPGSFTGLRTACAVAQGLAFGANAGRGIPVLPVDTLAAVAEEARHQHGCTEVVAVLDARMDEVYAAPYQWHDGAWHAAGELGLSAPEAVPVPAGWTVAGNAQAAYGDRLARAARHVQALPTATALLRLAPALLAAGQAVPAAEALPLYVRNKVAQTTAERAAAQAAKAAPAPPQP
jgi:tRNA threonylcarbamoyladenosine biosynthesis protein TsaB